MSHISLAYICENYKSITDFKIIKIVINVVDVYTINKGIDNFHHLLKWPGKSVLNGLVSLRTQGNLITTPTWNKVFIISQELELTICTVHGIRLQCRSRYFLY